MDEPDASADPLDGYYDLPPLPPEPPHRELTEAELEREWEEWQASLTALPAPDRFETEFGLPWIPAHAAVDDVALEEAAVVAQDAAVQIASVFHIAEAHRVAAILTAYDRSIADLAERFGPGTGWRGGLGAQAFFASMALQLKTHPRRIAHEVDAATVLRDRLPRTWAVFQSGSTTWIRAQLAVSAADGLAAAHWADFDEYAAGAVVTSTRLKSALRTKRERLQKDTAAQRARTTRERRTTILELGHDGEASLVITGPAAALVACNDALHRAAVAAHGVAGETRSIAMLRHDLAVDVITEGLRRPADPDEGPRVPARKAVDVSLVLTVPALGWLGMTTEQAVLGGYGPIAMEVAKDLAGDARSFIRVLTDPVTGVRLIMDQRVYRPPADLARWVRIRDGRSRFPGSERPAHLADVDHAREWQHGGPTNAANLVTMERPVHLMKSAGLFEERLHDSGVVGWTDAWGRCFEDPPAEPMDPAPAHLLPRDDRGDDPPF